MSDKQSGAIFPDDQPSLSGGMLSPGKLGPGSLGVFRHKYFLAGMLFLGLFLVQFSIDLQLSWLNNLQKNDVYKQATGFLLLGYLLQQWRLSHARTYKYEAKRLRKCFVSHKCIGVIAPLLFFIHSTGFGYGYVKILTLALLVTVVLGLLNNEILKKKTRIMQSIWLMAHIILSTLVLGLSGYHLYVTYAYS